MIKVYVLLNYNKSKYFLIGHVHTFNKKCEILHALVNILMTIREYTYGSRLN